MSTDQGPRPQGGAQVERAQKDAPWQGPPWQPHGGWRNTGAGPPWRRSHARSGRLFLRFAAVFGLLAVVVLGGLALLIYFAVRLAGGDRQTAALLWLGTCGLLLLFPMLAAFVGRRAFHNIAAPLSRLMEGAERVAAGDLSFRIPAGGRGEFADLSAAFNHMVEELALAEERRRNLTADVAHELRTPLQIIQGNLEGLIDGVYTPTQKHLEKTLDETRLLARLVEDLRVLSQAEAGQLTMHWERIDVGEMLADIGTSFSGQARAVGVKMEIILGGQAQTTDVVDASNQSTGVAVPLEPSLVVIADYDRLEQVVRNLMANALRHTPSGGRVVLGARETPGGVRLTVEDSGEGINAADLPFVFDRFWRGDRARSRRADPSQGSGLGLAIARQLVQAHGGEINVRSVTGQGTVFTIDLRADPRTG